MKKAKKFTTLREFRAWLLANPGAMSPEDVQAMTKELIFGKPKAKEALQPPEPEPKKPKKAPAEGEEG